MALGIQADCVHCAKAASVGILPGSWTRLTRMRSPPESRPGDLAFNTRAAFFLQPMTGQPDRVSATADHFNARGTIHPGVTKPILITAFWSSMTRKVEHQASNRLSSSR